MSIGLIECKESRRPWKAPGGTASPFLELDSDEDDVASKSSVDNLSDRIASQSRAFFDCSLLNRAASSLVCFTWRANRRRKHCSCLSDSTKLVWSVDTMRETLDAINVDGCSEGVADDGLEVTKRSWWADELSNSAAGYSEGMILPGSTNTKCND